MTEGSRSSIAVDANFRVRVAEEKRTRMRARLLAAILDVYMPDGRGGAAVIDDVVKQAGVSRGTFYKYFDSLEEAVTELGQEMANEMLLAFERMFGSDPSPAIAVVAGTQLTLARATMEPRWAAFTSRVDFVTYFSQRNPMSDIVTHSLQRARESNLLHFDSLAAAVDFIIGVTLEGVRRSAHGEKCTRSYITEITLMNMQGLGMDRTTAQQAIEEVWRRLQKHAPLIPWWNADTIVDFDGK